jgi:hypothetical protein
MFAMMHLPYLNGHATGALDAKAGECSTAVVAR